MKNKIIITLVLVVLIASTVAYLGFRKSTNTPSVDFNGEVKEFSITAKQFSFEPSVIEVNNGDLVKIKIRSIDVSHSFTLPDFRISERLSPNEEVEFEFVADKVGEFTFFCNVYCGEGHDGMGGKLIVK